MKLCHRVVRGICFHSVLIAFGALLCTAVASGQYFREFEDYGWSRGIDLSTPVILDIDGNGLLDLIVGSDAHGLGRWEQTAAGAKTFRRITRDFLRHDRNSQWAPCFVDLDGNGKRDILMGGNSSVTWYEESDAGSGSFVYVETLEGFSYGSVGRFWFGDLDGDGQNDLLIGNSLRTTKRYIQKSAHSKEFTKARDIAYSAPPNVYNHPELHDLDGDGLLELLSGGSDGRLRLYKQDAAVKDSFTLVNAEWSGITDAVLGAPAITDLDGDGLLDLFLGTEVGHVRHYEQPSAGALDNWVLREPNVLGTWDFGRRNAGFVHDLDGDGRLDILRTEVLLGGHDVMLPVQHFRFKQAGKYEVEYVGTLGGISMGIYESMTVTDFEPDGRLDILVYRRVQKLEHYRQSADNPFAFELVTEEFIPGFTTVQPVVPTVADIDGNGKLDLLLASTDNMIDRYEAEQAGSLNFSLVAANWKRTAEYYPKLFFIDYDNNGKLDMLQGLPEGGIRHWEQTEAGVAEFEEIDSPIELVNVGYMAHPFMFDVNLDGRLDLIVIDASGGISLFIDEGPLSVDGPGRLDITLPRLLAPYPLPASDAVVIPFEAAEQEHVAISVHDLLGRELYRLLDGVAPRPGLQTMRFPTSGLAPGIYFVRMTQGGRMASRPVVVGR